MHWTVKHSWHNLILSEEKRKNQKKKKINQVCSFCKWKILKTTGLHIVMNVTFAKKEKSKHFVLMLQVSNNIVTKVCGNCVKRL